MLIVLLVLVVAVVAFRRRAPKRLPPVHRWRHRVAISAGRYPYFAKTHLLTRSERAFHRALNEAIGDRFAVAVSVRLADVINCSREAWTAGHGPLISSKQLDFVLCEPETWGIVMAIELDDPTHQLADRFERDQFLDSAMRAAGVPLLRIHTAASYDAEALRSAILEAGATKRGRGKAA